MSNPTTEKKYAIEPSAVVSLAVSAAFLCLGFLIRSDYGVFTVDMLRTACIVVSAIVLWVQHPVPIGVSSLFIIVMLPLLGLVTNQNAAFNGMANAANFFVVASFGISIALRKTSVLGRALVKLLKRSNNSTSFILFAFMAVTFIISMIMSDIAAVVIAIAFVGDLIEFLPESDRATTGRAFMISLPFASALGGTATPAGSTVNVMALNLLQQNGGVAVSFMQWTLTALPVALVMLFLTWFFITKLFRISPISAEVVEAFVHKNESHAGFTSQEKKTLTIIGTMIVLWIAGSWISALNTTLVAIVGLFVMFLPGIQVLNWKEFKEGVAWEILLMGGATVVLGSLCKSTGLVDLGVNALIGYCASFSAWQMVLTVAALTTLVLVVIPVGPTTVNMLIIPIYAMSAAVGINPVMTAVTLGIFASNSTLIPLNSVFLISFSKGYWSSKDMFRTGILVSICWIVLAALWIPMISTVLF